MKKIALLVMALLALPSYTFAGGTCELVMQDTNFKIRNGTMLLEFTADSGDATMSCTLAAGSLIPGLLDGRHALGALAYDGAGTDLTVTSDLAITDGDGESYLSATGNGANIWNGDTSFYLEGPDGNDGYPKFLGHKSLIFTITGNVVNSGVGYLRLKLTGERNVR